MHSLRINNALQFALGRYAHPKIPQFFWAVMDQAVVSVANFGYNFVLARYAAPEDYGIYIILFAILMIVYSVVQSALTLEPLIILGSKESSGERNAYITQTITLNIAISLLAILALLILALLFSQFENAAYTQALLLATLPIIPMNLRYFTRCLFIMNHRFDKAFLCDVSVLATAVIGFFVLLHVGTITNLQIALLFALAEGSAVVLWAFLKRQSAQQLLVAVGSSLKTLPQMRQWPATRRNWTYGKWVLLASAASYLCQQAQFLILPSFIPLAALAGYRAAYLVAQPIYLFATGIEAYVWSSSVLVLKQSGRSKLVAHLVRIMIPISVAVIVYIWVAGINAKWIMDVAFAGKFTSFAYLVWYFTIAALVTFWAKMVNTAFRTLEATKSIYHVSLVSGAIGIILLFGLTWLLSVEGAAISYLISSMLVPLLLGLSWNRVKRAYDLRFNS